MEPLHRRERVAVVLERAPCGRGELRPVGLHEPGSRGERLEQLGPAGVEDRRAGGALEELAVQRGGGAGRERPGEHHRGGPGDGAAVGLDEGGELVGADRAGVLHQLGRAAAGALEERGAGARPAARGHGVERDPQGRHLGRGRRGGSPPEDRHRPRRASQVRERHGDVEHLAARAVPRLLCPVHLPGRQRREAHDDLPGRGETGGDDRAGGKREGWHGTPRLVTGEGSE